MRRPAPYGLSDLAGLLDDAAVFPPGNAALPQAVRAYLGRRSASHAALVGTLVVTPAQVAALPAVLDDVVAVPLPLSVVVRDLADLPGVAAAVSADRRLRLAAVEIAAPGESAVRAAVEAAARLPAGVGVWVEPGWGRHLPVATGLLGDQGFGLKLRTGGTTPDAFPTERVLAEALTCAVTRGVRVKATAGLHRAVRHRDPSTGFEHHGFLNLVLAADAADNGTVTAARRLAETRPEAVGAAVAALGPDRLATVRARRFVSFGTCDVDDPRRDLETLGLLAYQEVEK
ncbi:MULTISPECIES: hypothetical protein [unclassified Frankia]|uniref:hypothetical protein n=1 Tax=unclassified Frankia TaxID=2632575 RepID=UPI002AD388FB|nr:MULTISPECIES: hypothetical protein [unclassified Frankia]